MRVRALLVAVAGLAPGGLRRTLERDHVHEPRRAASRSRTRAISSPDSRPRRGRSRTARRSSPPPSAWTRRTCWSSPSTRSSGRTSRTSRTSSRRSSTPRCARSRGRPTSRSRSPDREKLGPLDAYQLRLEGHRRQRLEDDLSASRARCSTSCAATGQLGDGADGSRPPATARARSFKLVSSPKAPDTQNPALGRALRGKEYGRRGGLAHLCMLSPPPVTRSVTRCERLGSNIRPGPRTRQVARSWCLCEELLTAGPIRAVRRPAARAARRPADWPPARG